MRAKGRPKGKSIVLDADLRPTSPFAVPKSLKNDTNGAVLVIGAFMAVFLVGLLYHLLGIGESVVHREHLQDAADAGAFTAAVVHARAMNLIGLINLIQLISYALLIALLHLSQLTWACSAGAYTGAYPWVLCPGEHDRIESVRQSARPQLISLIRASTAAAESVRDATPELAATEASRVAEAAFGYPVVAGVLVRRDMPLSTSDVEILCFKSYVFEDALAKRATPDVYPVMDVRAPVVVRYQYPECRGETLPAGVGPQLMDPPNQSGTEPLQIRFFVVGDDVRVRNISFGVDMPNQVIGSRPPVATRDWYADPNLLRPLANVAVAQAEYYSTWELANILQSDTVQLMPEENTFHMYWTARLRRLRVPIDVDRLGPDMQTAFQNWWLQSALPACEQACLRRACAGTCATLAPLGAIGHVSVH